MRTFAAILLLTIFTFNWIGYQLLSSYLQNCASVHLDQKLDNTDYVESELFEIKIAVSAPYQNSTPNFERCYGEVEISGTHYTYVKRKFYNDSLFLLCLPNKEKTDIVKAEDRFFKLVNGLQAGTSEKNTGKGNTPGYKNVIAEFIAPESKWPSDGSFIETAAAFSERKMSLYHSFKNPSPDLPPEHYILSSFC